MVSSDILPTSCDLCPRACGANRSAGVRGICGADDSLVIARAALHLWEEPPISGNAGSGTVFFSNCPLRCVYCQNHVIACGRVGRAVSVERLAQICLEQQERGALNVNFVTPTHYAPHIRAAVLQARKQGLSIPVIWNTSGYETVRTLRRNAGVVDVYLTDFKYASAQLAQRYSAASDYAEVALAALDVMVETAGSPRFDEVDGLARMTGGVIVRHLMLPGCLDDSKAVVRMVHERYGSQVLLSLMNQYTPHLSQIAAGGDGLESAVWAKRTLEKCPELACRVSGEEYERLLDYADALGVQDYFWQEGDPAQESFIPPFDLTGV